MLLFQILAKRNCRNKIVTGEILGIVLCVSGRQQNCTKLRWWCDPLQQDDWQYMSLHAGIAKGKKGICRLAFHLPAPSFSHHYPGTWKIAVVVVFFFRILSSFCRFKFFYPTGIIVSVPSCNFKTRPWRKYVIDLKVSSSFFQLPDSFLSVYPSISLKRFKTKLVAAILVERTREADTVKPFRFLLFVVVVFYPGG